MSTTFICLACGEEKPGSPQLAGRQSFCGKSVCQRGRRAGWQRERVGADSDYRTNHRQSDQAWRHRNSGYWSEYRRTHPEKAERNRALQRIRNRRRRQPPSAGASEPVIAKMDASTVLKLPDFSGGDEFWLIPVIAKMDAWRVKIVVISKSCV